MFFLFSSLFLFVFGDDHMTCHMGADEDPSADGKASRKNEG